MKGRTLKGLVSARSLSCLTLVLLGACGGTDVSSLFADDGASGAPSLAGSAGSAGGALPHSSGGVGNGMLGGGQGGSRPSHTAGAGAGNATGGAIAGAGAVAGAGSNGPGAGSGGTAGSNPNPPGGEGGSMDGGASGAGTTSSGGSNGGSSTVGGSGNGGGGSSSGGTESGGSAGSGGRGGGESCESETERCDGLDNDCDGEIDDGARCPQGCEGHAIDERGYVFCGRTDVTFRVANERCGDLDMHLAWVESAEENTAIVSVAGQIGDPSERLWLGGADRTEGDWRWIDAEENPSDRFWSGGRAEAGGKPVSDRYVNWGNDRPNDADSNSAEDCLNLSLNDSELPRGSWNDDECSARWGFVCEAD